MFNFFGRLSGDRRRAYRHPLDIPLRYRVRVTKGLGEEHSSRSENVSETGIFFMTERAIGIGTVLDVFLEMPNTIHGEATAPWLCTGHVVRITSKGMKRGVGVQFDCFEVMNTKQFAYGSTLTAAS